MLVNPEYVDIERLPPILKKWDILIAPEPDPIEDRLLKITSLCGKWLNMNVLMIDEKRVIVDTPSQGDFSYQRAKRCNEDDCISSLKRLLEKQPKRRGASEIFLG